MSVLDDICFQMHGQSEGADIKLLEVLHACNVFLLTTSVVGVMTTISCSKLRVSNFAGQSKTTNFPQPLSIRIRKYCDVY